MEGAHYQYHPQIFLFVIITHNTECLSSSYLFHKHTQFQKRVCLTDPIRTVPDTIPLITVFIFFQSGAYDVGVIPALS